MSHQEPTIGRNRTGIQMSPILSKEMMDAADKFEWNDVAASLEDPEKLEMDYIKTAHSIGSIPVPLTVRGMAKTGLDKLKGERPEVLVDKLGERLAFERTGVRLYDGLIRKCMAENQLSPHLSLERIEAIRNEELQHMFTIKLALEGLGADPTAMTPAADVMAVASMGLNQVINDPRTSIAQCLEAILVAELADQDGWQLLIELARGMGEDSMASSFMQAMQEEEQHVVDIRMMLKNMTLSEAGLSSKMPSVSM